VKYAILKRITAATWVPTTHSFDIATWLGKFIYVIGNKAKMDCHAYIFEQTVKHAETDAVKFPIAFPTLLRSIILDQYPSSKTANVIAKKRVSPLMLHYKLFGADHIPDIVGTSGSAPPTGLMSSGGRLLEVLFFCSAISASILHDCILFACILEQSCFS